MKFRHFTTGLLLALGLAGTAQAAAPKKGPADRLFEEGNASDAIGDYEGAAKAYEAAANLGHVTAMFNLGQSLYAGKTGAKPDPLAALVWWEKCAAKGGNVCVYRIGVMRLKGEGVAADPAAGLAMIGRVADNPKATAGERGDAYQALAVAAFKGWGQEANSTRYLELLTKAANLGHAGAQAQLGDAYEAGTGTSANPALAYSWYLKAAGNGNTSAMIALSTYFDEGKGGAAKSPETAFKWLRKAADSGNERGLALAGMRLMAGQGVTQDERRGAALIEQAARKGLVTAQFLAGSNAYRGTGVEKDPYRALMWYERASQQGDKNAEKIVEALTDQLRLPDERGGGNDPQAHVDEAPAGQAAPLAGSSWELVDASGSLCTFRFVAEGKLHYRNEGKTDFDTSGVWTQDGDKVFVSLNNGYAKYSARIRGERMEGLFTNKGGWKIRWAAYRMP